MLTLGSTMPGVLGFFEPVTTPELVMLLPEVTLPLTWYPLRSTAPTTTTSPAVLKLPLPEKLLAMTGPNNGLGAVG